MTDPKPVAWMHTMHMEGDQTRAMLTFYDYADCYEPDRTVFGKPGRDYSEEYAVSSVPLYAAPQPCPDCAALRDEVERLQRACIKAAAPDFMTQAERDALHDFVQFLRSTNGGEALQILDCEPFNKSPKERFK